MPRYIDAVELLKRLQFQQKYGSTQDSRGRAKAILEVIHTPTADVEPVRHGRWEDYYVEDRQEGLICTVCKEICKCEFDYCPNCGAKMDGGVSDETDVRGDVKAPQDAR